jgi:hypothetical protein
MSMTQEAPSPEQAVIVLEKRSNEGRQRPYRVLRALARVYTIFAPILAAVLAYNAVAAWFIEETLTTKALVSLEFAVKAVVAFIVLRGVAQMIYLVFDIARGVNKLTGDDGMGKI